MSLLFTVAVGAGSAPATLRRLSQLRQARAALNQHATSCGNRPRTGSHHVDGEQVKVKNACRCSVGPEPDAQSPGGQIPGGF